MLMKISITAALALAPLVESFYVPGVAVKTFAENQPVELKVNSITSKHTQVPRSFYSLPVCKPDGGIKNKSESLGEFLTGNRIQNSGYKINMRKDSYCQILCQTPALSKKDARKLDLAIRYEYHNNWIVDNLPSYSVGHSRNGGEVKSYGGGFPVGVYLSVKDDKAANAKELKKKRRKRFKKISKEEAGVAFVYNHLKIIMQYHQPDISSNGYRIVGFGVEPMSVKHQFVNGYKWDGKDPEGRKVPLETCNSDGNSAASHHLQVGEIVAGGQMVVTGEPILYTYDVQWQYSKTTWATRWDVYMHETDSLSKEVHWMSISNSALVLLLLSGIVAVIVVKNLRKDIAGYNAVMLDEELDGADFEDSGWKLIHADVFRPPQSHPMLFCTGVGSGVQILITTFATLLFAVGGLLSPARRGSLLTCILVVYMLCGVVSGFISARLYKSFRGRMWQRCTIFTATLFPGLCFGVFLFFNTYTAFIHSSLSIPFLDVLLVTVMFCGVQIPLVFLGAYFGYKQESISYPTKVSTIARAIPEPKPALKPIVGMILAGLVPFSAVFVELTLVMSGLWGGEFYYVFGYLTVVFLILCIVIAEVCVLNVYLQYVNENHRWWWLSFVSGGSVALYLFLFSVDYFQDLQPSSMLITYLLFFGYMFLISVAVFLAMGSLGFLCCFFFSRAIFASIKVD